MKKVLVGMSGGVDSSVAVALLQERGYEVIGVTMIQRDTSLKFDVGGRACFLGDKDNDFEDVKKVAKKLGIKHYFIDVAIQYSKEVLDYFDAEYSAGRTPNPCIMCNKKIKFGVLLGKATSMNIDFDYFATGHYANIKVDKVTNKYLLKKAKYLKKDQSYFLSMLNQDQLKQVIFPLGELTKVEVRRKAREIGLSIAEKKESQDFYSGDYTDLLKSKPQEGLVRSVTGEVIGKHRGISLYTIGQRRGLGIGYSKPIYVVKIDANKNEIIVGENKDLYRTSFVAGNVNWIACHPQDSIKANTKIRHGHPGASSTVTSIGNGEVKVVFENAQRAITQGQYAVFYDGDTVLGGGQIKEVL